MSCSSLQQAARSPEYPPRLEHIDDEASRFQSGGSTSSTGRPSRPGTPLSWRGAESSRAQALRDLAAAASPRATCTPTLAVGVLEADTDVEDLLFSGGSVMVPPVQWRQQLLSSAGIQERRPGERSALRSRKHNLGVLRSSEQRASQGFFEEARSPRRSQGPSTPGSARPANAGCTLDTQEVTAAKSVALATSPPTACERHVPSLEAHPATNCPSQSFAPRVSSAGRRLTPRSAARGPGAAPMFPEATEKLCGLSRTPRAPSAPRQPRPGGAARRFA
ncbi:unnamed protein product [Polarella glacialis]|uniref:Uncharacterized protein n=1 Tax=Polarella glacialis TaxID=89957 RepID=A0A813DW80_POLGL|nr:unnamed protein product [Polarella glacialis]CAE8659221.1 unnamed protein product [Polarella glacialis]